MIPDNLNERRWFGAHSRGRQRECVVDIAHFIGDQEEENTVGLRSRHKTLKAHPMMLHIYS